MPYPDPSPPASHLPHPPALATDGQLLDRIPQEERGDWTDEELLENLRIDTEVGAVLPVFVRFSCAIFVCDSLRFRVRFFVCD